MAYARIRLRRATKSQWLYANPILSEGETVLEVPETGVGTGLVNIKVGDGTSYYENLPYAVEGAALSDVVAELSNSVDGYDKVIEDVKESIENVQNRVTDIRKILIQASEPASNLVLGEVWISSDIVTGNITISNTKLDLEAGDIATLTLENTLSAFDRIDWESSDEAVAQLSKKTNNSCKVTGAIRGVANVTASAYSNGSVLATVTCKVTVSVSGSISVSPTEMRMIVGKSNTIKLTNSLTTFDSVDWVSSASTYAAVTASSNTEATIMPYKSGGATIYARVMLNGSAIATAQTALTIVGMAFNKESSNIIVGGNDKIALNNTMINGTDYDDVVWETSASNICVISSSNTAGATLAGVSAGSATITARAQLDGQDVQVITMPVTVGGTVTISDTYKSMGVGETAGLSIINTHNSGEYDNVKWTTTDGEVVRLKSQSTTECTIEAMSAGSAVITCNLYLNGKSIDSASCTVAVNGSLKMTNSTKEVSVGSTVELTATNTLVQGSYDKIKWITNDSSICTVTSYDGTTANITGVAAGSARVTVLAVDSSGATVASDICVVTVK